MSDYTEKQIREWQNGALMFSEALNHYIQKRYHLDPDFKLEELDLTESDEDYSCDIFGDDITIQWRETDRCGDSKYLQESFPLSHLWSIDWDQMEQEWTAARRKKKEAEAAKAAERAARQAKLQEARERAELERLRAKYRGATV